MRTLSTSTRRIARTLVASTALALLASACGSDAKSADTAPATTAAATTAAPTTVDHTTMDHSSTPAAGSAATTGVIAVTASDYHFEGIPAQIAAGSKLAVTNSSTKEFHELVVFRLPDSETRSVPELLALGDAKLKEMFGSSEPAAVLLAPPGGAAQIEAVGDGTLTEPGRYIFVCTIPVGADPAAIAAAMSGDEDAPPPAESAGPFHYMAGMWAEAVVA